MHEFYRMWCENFSKVNICLTLPAAPAKIPPPLANQTNRIDQTSTIFVRKSSQLLLLLFVLVFTQFHYVRHTHTHTHEKRFQEVNEKLISYFEATTNGLGCWQSREELNAFATGLEHNDVFTCLINGVDSTLTYYVKIICKRFSYVAWEYNSFQSTINPNEGWAIRDEKIIWAC